MTMKTFLSAGVLAGLAASSAFGAIAYPVAGGSVGQNFDTLAASGIGNAFTNDVTLPGWSVLRSGVAGTPGARDGTNTAATLYNAGTGSSFSGALYSFGFFGDRSLGTVGSGNAAAGEYVTALVLQNTTGTTLTSFTLNFRSEQWRNGGATVAQSAIFDFSTFAAAPVAADLTATNTAGFTAPGASFDLVGNVFGGAAAGAAVDGNTIGATAQGGTQAVSWAPGSFLVLRWWDDNHAGSDHGLSIDDVTFSAVPTPGSVALLALGGLVATRRRRN